MILKHTQALKVWISVILSLKNLAMPISLKSKLPSNGASIFSTMNKLATEHQALNLSQGFPDFAVDPALIGLVEKYMRMGHNQYAPSAGVPAFREILSEITARQHGHRYDADKEVTISSGATEAIAAALACSIREGDEVIIFTPAYDCYAPLVELNGGVPVYIQLNHPSYNIDWATVKNRINHRTKMIIINTPHNPSATVMEKEDFRQLVEITQGTNILLLSDEVYEHIVFEPHQHHSVAAFPALAERSFRIGSLGKTLHTTGWKIGYCMAPENLMEEFRKVHQYLVFSVNTPVQYAMAEYLQYEDNIKVAELYRQKRDYFSAQLKGGGFKTLPSQGSYFQLLDYSAISEKPAREFAIELCANHGVAAIPLSVFYHHPQENKVLRFCFAKNAETLAKAGELLNKVPVIVS